MFLETPERAREFSLSFAKLVLCLHQAWQGRPEKKESQKEKAIHDNKDTSKFS